MGLEEPAYLLAQRTPRDIDHGHFGVARLYIMTALRHWRKADRGDVQLSLGIFLRHLRERYRLRDEDHALAPVEEDRLTHLHDYCEKPYKLLSVIVLDQFSDDYFFQRFVSNFDH